ncbi:hypothetical protein EPN28_03655 [Patescibacteria group bacterium]|nr:MAG: hypothetical protein EPN28_03655 [Patescibacteria group bacterium]
MFLIVDNNQEGAICVSGIIAGSIVPKACGIIAGSIVPKACGARLSFPRLSTGESSGNRTSIVEAFDKFLKKQKLPLKKIKGIGVVSGAESFTASRLAATFGNTMAYALKIPVISLEPGWTPAQALARFKRAKPGRYIAPQYSGEARVTPSSPPLFKSLS